MANETIISEPVPGETGCGVGSLLDNPFKCSYSGGCHRRKYNDARSSRGLSARGDSGATFRPCGCENCLTRRFRKDSQDTPAGGLSLFYGVTEDPVSGTIGVGETHWPVTIVPVGDSGELIDAVFPMCEYAESVRLLCPTCLVGTEGDMDIGSLMNAP